MKTLLFILGLINIVKAQNITAHYTSLSSGCLNTPICFTDLSVSNNGPVVSWTWNFGDGLITTLQNPCHTYAFPGTYTVTLFVHNSNGNSDSTWHPIVIKSCEYEGIEDIYPNVYTPNGDGVNDAFTFSIIGATDVSFGIMNRWGNLIKNSIHNANNYISWDGYTTSGEECTNGVYFYTLAYKDAKGDLIKKNGYVTLIK